MAEGRTGSIWGSGVHFQRGTNLNTSTWELAPTYYIGLAANLGVFTASWMRDPTTGEHVLGVGVGKSRFSEVGLYVSLTREPTLVRSDYNVNHYDEFSAGAPVRNATVVSQRYSSQYNRITAVVEEVSTGRQSFVTIQVSENQQHRVISISTEMDDGRIEVWTDPIALSSPVSNSFSPRNPSPDIDPRDSFFDYAGGGNGWRNTRSQLDTYVGEDVGRGAGGSGTEEGFSLPSSRTGYSSRGVNDLEGPELAQRAAEQNALELQRQRELAERAQEAIAEHDLSGEMEKPEDPSDETTSPRPIILDLDGNSISITELNQSQQYVDGDGQIKEKRASVLIEQEPPSTSDLDALWAA